MSAEGATGSTIKIGADTCTASTRTNAGAQFVAVSSEGIAPAGVVFSALPINKALAISLGDIDGGYVKGLWFERTTTAGAPGVLDSVTLRIEGDST